MKQSLKFTANESLNPGKGCKKSSVQCSVHREHQMYLQHFRYICVTWIFQNHWEYEVHSLPRNLFCYIIMIIHEVLSIQHKSCHWNVGPLLLFQSTLDTQNNLLCFILNWNEKCLIRAYIFFSTDSPEYWYSCSLLTSLSCCTISMCCQLCSISYNHMCLKIRYNSKLIVISLLQVACVLQSTSTLPPLLYFFFPFYSFQRAGICVVLCKSTLSAHLYDKSECQCPCTLHSEATSQYTSASSVPFLTLFYTTNWSGIPTQLEALTHIG